MTRRIKPSPVAIVHGSRVRRGNEITPYVQACEHFYDLCIDAMEKRGLQINLYDKQIPTRRLSAALNIPGEWSHTLNAFLFRGGNLTPTHPLYFHLCDQLGIDPGEAGFDYELIEK